MIRGMFRATADQQVIAELKATSQFRFYVDKLRQAHAKAMDDLTYASPQDLPTKQGYARALNELIDELTKPGA